MSDGNSLNVTMWPTQTFSEERLPLQQGTVQFVMTIDIISVFNKGIDYQIKIISANTQDPGWTQNIYEISAFGNIYIFYSKRAL
jgi:hypothetical protein